MFGEGSQLVPVLVQPLQFGADELRAEDPGPWECQPDYFIIIKSHAVRIDLQHLQNLLKHLLVPQNAPIQPTVKPLVKGPLALLLQDPARLPLRVVLPTLALKKYMAVVSVIVQVLDHLLEGFGDGGFGGADFAFAAADVGALFGVSKAARFVVFGWLKLLEDGLRRSGGQYYCLSLL